MGAPRSAEQIRRSVETNRAELGTALERLRVEIDHATDWRATLNRHRQQVVIGAAVAGFVLGGGLGAVVTLVIGRKPDYR